MPLFRNRSQPRQSRVRAVLTMPLRAVALLLALVHAAACRGEVSSRRPPAAEFLLAAGDSTYWIRSSADGIRVRSAPILLTLSDNRFYEVFIADDLHDYAQASFASARVWGRDITRDDSLLVFEDGAVPREAKEWIKRHPQAVPLDPTDIGPDTEPPTVVSDDIEVIDVHGPWLTVGHSLDVDVSGRPGHRHRRTNRVVDVRDGTRTSIRTLFGDTEAERIQKAARQALAELKDSVERSTDGRSVAARRTLGSFVFDSLSFGLTDVDRGPAVAFLVPGTGAEGEPLSIHLPPLKANRPAWWNAVLETLPQWNTDSTELTWRRRLYDVRARPIDGGDQLVIELVDRDTSRAPIRWAIATVPSPTYQLIALDNAPLETATRVALAKAFDQSSVLNGRIQRASYERFASPQFWLRMVTWRVPLLVKHERSPCCAKSRRVCGASPAGISPLHRLPVRADAGHSDSGNGCRMAGL